MAYPKEHRADGRAGGCAAVDGGMTRRAVLAGAAAAVGSMLAAPARAQAASAVEELPETMETSAEFNGPYTAWAGYASTARHSIASGAVPVKSPASPEVAWTAGLAAPTDALVLRQSGQKAMLYVLAGASIERRDAATGDLLGAAELPAPACAGAQPVFAEASLAVVLETGQVAVFDEELAPAWVSAAPALPAGAASWGMSSQVVSLGGALHAALVALDASGAALGIELFSLAGIDGSLFWSARLPVGAGAPASPAPRLIAAGEGLLLLDGGSTARLVDIASGEVSDEIMLAGAIEGRIAECGTGLSVEPLAAASWTVGDASGSVSLLRAVDGRLELGGTSALAAAGAPWRLLPFAPAVARGHAYFWARRTGDPVDAAVCLDVALDRIGAGEVGEPVGGELPTPAAPLLAVVCGASDAVVTLYAVAASGAVAAIEGVDGADAACAASELWNPSGAIPRTEPLVNRDGTLFLATAPSNGSKGGLLTALAPDEARSAATPVGGSEGIDTLGSALAGITLPNGAGVGVGALFLAATFGLYAFIRNRGGRQRRDEGVDEWREQHGEDDGDDLDRGPGAAW
ncbi:hypothetical protein [Collinsella sp. D33t1_170424_A12]|uniref:hypothetical protein n=1 Tax=Collinsella sp. D33t1_170424_A12 TaxID=2787135 RepID=UPI00189760A0|nr:hypothetical protein [Collinsella sp. D33t1_170424_A12]